MRQRRLGGLLAMVLACVGVPMAAPLAGAEDLPVVTITPSEERSETLSAGPCYEGPVTVEQPEGFLITRTGPTESALVVRILTSNIDADSVSTSETDVIIPSWSSEVLVPRRDEDGPRLKRRSATVTVTPGTGYVEGDPATARLTWYMPAAETSPTATCDITDRVGLVELQVGVEHHGTAFLWGLSEFGLASGVLPPGLQVDEKRGLAGRPTEAGVWDVALSECPLPAVGRPRCGTIAMTVTVRDGVVVPATRDLSTICPPETVPSAGFLDVDPAHRAAVDCIVNRRIARGYEAGEFRGRASITRAQAAVMLQRLILDAGGRLPETGRVFADLVGDRNEPAIRSLAGAGIVHGLQNSTLFGPGQPISRAQLVTLVVRTVRYLGIEVESNLDRFADDDTSPHEPAIEASASEGIVGGTSTPGVFAPDQPVRRDQAASFLARAADLVAEHGR